MKVLDIPNISSMDIESMMDSDVEVIVFCVGLKMDDFDSSFPSVTDSPYEKLLDKPKISPKVIVLSRYSFSIVFFPPS